MHSLARTVTNLAAMVLLAVLWVVMIISFTIIEQACYLVGKGRA